MLKYIGEYSDDHKFVENWRALDTKLFEVRGRPTRDGAFKSYIFSFTFWKSFGPPPSYSFRVF